MVLVLLDVGPSSAASSQRKDAMRQTIERRLFRLRTASESKDLEPYQVLLREAQRAYTRGDRKTERDDYRKVLDMLRAERGSYEKGLTGSRTSDKELEDAHFRVTQWRIVRDGKRSALRNCRHDRHRRLRHGLPRPRPRAGPRGGHQADPSAIPRRPAAVGPLLAGGPTAGLAAASEHPHDLRHRPAPGLADPGVDARQPQAGHAGRRHRPGLPAHRADELPQRACTSCTPTA